MILYQWVLTGFIRIQTTQFQFPHTASKEIRLHFKEAWIEKRMILLIFLHMLEKYLRHISISMKNVILRCQTKARLGNVCVEKYDSNTRSKIVLVSYNIIHAYIWFVYRYSVTATKWRISIAEKDSISHWVLLYPSPLHTSITQIL